VAGAPLPESPARAFARVHALVLLGRPGAGKGTQGHQISAEYGIPEVSTGAMLREAVRRRSPLGLQAQAVMEAGFLVPDDLVCRVVKERVAQPDCTRGFILDGFPRNTAQAEFLDALLRCHGLGSAFAVYINVDSESLVKRLSGRRMCPQCGTIYNVYLNPPRKQGICDREGAALVCRQDDSEESIQSRFIEFESQTRPVVDYYRQAGLLAEVDGNASPEAVTAQLFAVLKNL
jgi:adenylate kinase